MIILFLWHYSPFKHKYISDLIDVQIRALIVFKSKTEEKVIMKN
jgi:hypothetical protein